MRTAICFTGTGRALEHTHHNLKKYLIDVESGCDIFAHISDSKFINQIHQYFTFDNIKEFRIEKDREIDLGGLQWHPNWPAGPHSGEFPKQTYLNMLLSRLKCGQMLQNYCEKNKFVYDKVIFSRLDISFLKDIPTELDLDTICTSDFHNFDRVQGAGCNDRFAISNYENMKMYLSEFDRVQDFCRSGGALHAESTLFWHLNSSNLQITRYPIRFTRVRPGGKRIDERLSNPVLSWEDH